MYGKAYNYVLSTLGVMWSVQDINNIISLLLLIISICNLLYTFVRTIVSRVKNKEYDEIPNDMNKLKSDLEKIQQYNKEEK